MRNQYGREPGNSSNKYQRFTGAPATNAPTIGRRIAQPNQRSQRPMDTHARDRGLPNKGILEGEMLFGNIANDAKRAGKMAAQGATIGYFDTGSARPGMHGFPQGQVGSSGEATPVRSASPSNSAEASGGTNFEVMPRLELNAGPEARPMSSGVPRGLPAGSRGELGAGRPNQWADSSISSELADASYMMGGKTAAIDARSALVDPSDRSSDRQPRRNPANRAGGKPGMFRGINPDGGSNPAFDNTSKGRPMGPAN